MRNFRNKRWVPTGARPHVLAPAGAYASKITDWLLGGEPAQWMGMWYENWQQILAPLPHTSQHLTLAWLDVPAADTPAERLPELREALRRVLARGRPVELRYDGIVASVHGIHLQVVRTEELCELAGTVAETVRAVFGNTEALHTPDLDTWVPHIALAYGIADADTPSLDIELEPLADPLGSIVCLNHDTWAPGWPTSYPPLTDDDSVIPTGHPIGHHVAFAPIHPLGAGIGLIK